MAKRELTTRTTSHCDTTTDAEKLVDQQPVDARRVREGAQAVVGLMDRLQEVSNATCSRLGDERDGRDYRAMALDIAGTFLHCLSPHQHPDVRLGFIRAMTDLLAVNADGCGVESDGWDPLRRTEFAFSGRLNSFLKRHQACEQPTADVSRVHHG